MKLHEVRAEILMKLRYVTHKVGVSWQKMLHKFTSVQSSKGVKIDPKFSALIWDPSHWINLAILDI